MLELPQPATSCLLDTFAVSTIFFHVHPGSWPTTSMAQEIPCPLGIVQDFAMGWSMGAFGSYPFHWYQARKKAPSKSNLKVPPLDTGRQIRRRAVYKSWITGRSFGRWTGLFAVCNCFMPMFIGPLHPVLSGGLAGGLVGGILARKNRKGE